MSIDQNFIPAFSIEEVILDKDTGAPLSGGQVYFEQDNNRGVLKPVYQITGTSPNYTFTQLPNPMTLSSIGTFEDSLSNPVVPYFFPYDGNFDPEYYYVRVESADGVPQFDREAVPYIPSNDSAAGASSFENELANPQFSEVSFDTDSATYVYNFTAASLEVVNIAPNWDIVVSSPAGATVTVSQSKPTGSLNILTNPGTLLNINSAGVSRLRLRQRLYGSPNLWGGSYIAGSFVAKTFGGTSSTVTMYYTQSNGTVVDQVISTGILNGDGTYDEHPGTVLIPASDSTETFPDAYVDIELDLPTSVEINITSIMLAFTGSASQDSIVYSQDTQDRQIDHLFHYYKPQLEFKPIPSMLTAWDFPLNPAQIGGTATQTMNTQATTPKYLWDQTIGASLVGNIAVARNSVTGGIQATTANADEAFYYIQYLTGEQAKEILGNKLAVNIDSFRTQAGGAVTANVYLYSGASGASFPTLPTSLGTVAADGVFTLTAANWTLIPRGNLGTATGSLSTVNTADYTTLNDRIDLNFNGWEMDDTATISDTNKFAIVVTFSCPTTATVVTVNSISLNKGDIATRPAAQTIDQVLHECQYYYESSYNLGVVPGTSSSPQGQLIRPQVAFDTSGVDTAYACRAAAFSFAYNTIKRTAPTIAIYNPATGASNGVRSALSNGSSDSVATGDNTFTTNWTASSVGTKGAAYVRQTATNLATVSSSSAGIEASIRFHFVADARLGVV
jgi:hypothetical protein